MVFLSLLLSRVPLRACKNQGRPGNSTECEGGGGGMWKRTWTCKETGLDALPCQEPARLHSDIYHHTLVGPRGELGKSSSRDHVITANQKQEGRGHPCPSPTQTRLFSQSKLLNGYWPRPSNHGSESPPRPPPVSSHIQSISFGPPQRDKARGQKNRSHIQAEYIQYTEAGE